MASLIYRHSLCDQAIQDNRIHDACIGCGGDMIFFDMDIPSDRRDTSKDNNRAWLLRNLAAKNKDHDLFDFAIDKVKKKGIPVQQSNDLRDRLTNSFQHNLLDGEFRPGQLVYSLEVREFLENEAFSIIQTSILRDKLVSSTHEWIRDCGLDIQDVEAFVDMEVMKLIYKFCQDLELKI